MIDFDPRGVVPLRYGWDGLAPMSWAEPRPAAAPGKRAFDVAAALAILALAAVPMLLIALAVRLDSPGPALFRQTRVGLGGRPFTMLKFRTMRREACASGDLVQAMRADPRVTRLGRWLRRTSLDELPQLLNVLAGDMSLVGPRPHAPGTRAGSRRFEEIALRYQDRHRVRPGLTGLAQVRGLRGETETEAKLLDAAIVLRTPWAVLRMRNAH
jgi:lipopolysaccharide/colanic/teichoic acid biosynthesis glycosyltransferase